MLIINLKNYEEILGESALRMMHSAEHVSARHEVDIFVAPPTPALGSLAAGSSVRVLGQRVEDAVQGKSTGAVIPEALKAWGCAGSIINHSECRVPLKEIANLVPRMRRLGLLSCVCAETPEEVAAMAKTDPDYIAIEPPGLIGTGVSVSKAQPTLISDSVHAADGSGYHGMVLCGAGIVTGADVGAAVRLGSQGVLVASSIVKATDWDAKIEELTAALL